MFSFFISLLFELFLYSLLSTVFSSSPSSGGHTLLQMKIKIELNKITNIINKEINIKQTYVVISFIPNLSNKSLKK